MTSFTIQRATNNLFTVGLTTYTVQSNNATTYSNTQVTRFVTYYYRIRANNVAHTCEADSWGAG